MLENIRDRLFHFLRSDVRFVEIIFLLYSVWSAIAFSIPSTVYVFTGPVYTNTIRYVTQPVAISFFVILSVTTLIAIRQRVAFLRKTVLSIGSLLYWIYILFIYKDLGITLTTGLYGILVVAGIFTAWRLTATD